MTLAVVRNIGAAHRLRSEQHAEDFEQEIVDQYALAMAAAGLTDRHIAASRSVVVEFARALGAPMWTATCQDADRHLAALRRQGQAKSTIFGKVSDLARFYDFVIDRYQADVNALTGYVVQQPVDEYNRPRYPLAGRVRVPPAETEVDALFTAWGASLPGARKYLPAARDYFAASLWRRLGLRINETVMLDIRDWRPDLGTHGKLHIRHGKGSGGRGPKSRLVPAINDAEKVIDWWLAEVRHQFGGDWRDPDAPMLPSERHDPVLSRCRRAGDDALRSGLAVSVSRYLPSWSGRLSPHVLRHFCASSLYGRGLDLKAIQELLGHEWLSTTTRYVHVRSEHIEQAWIQANQRTESRFGTEGI